MCSQCLIFKHTYRIALDDNHDSVVLACAKVMQSILSCEINENFFNIKEVELILSEGIRFTNVSF